MCGSDQKADGGTVYKRMLIKAILQIGKKIKKKTRADWEKSIKEAKIRIIL